MIELILSLLSLFVTFFKIGLFTFGGGYAMLPLMQEEVLGHGWATEEEIINFIAVSESTPGPFAVNMATYIGAETVGAEFGALASVLGSFFATLGVVLPSFIIILIVARVYESFKNSKTVQGVMSGLKPAVIGLIAAAVLSVAITVFFPEGLSLSVFGTLPFYLSLTLCLIMAVLAFKKVHPIIIICSSAVAGITLGYALNLPV